MYLYLENELLSLCKDIPDKRIVHVGARIGEEAGWYEHMGCSEITWIEANPALIDTLKSNVGLLGHKVIFALIADKDGKEVTFNVANNAGESSSMLQLKEHKRLHPEVYYTHSFIHVTMRLDSLGLSPNILVIDVQGAEGLVIKGATETLKGVKVLYSEVNFMECYEGCTLFDDFDRMLQPNFEMRAIKRVTKGWGDAIWVKKSHDKT